VDFAILVKIRNLAIILPGARFKPDMQDGRILPESESIMALLHIHARPK